MAEARLLITRAGPHVSVQDGGRPGLMRFGVPASGAMDRAALALANAALGQDPGAAGIEVSPGGLSLTLQGADLTLAVAGGGFVLDSGAGRLGSWSVLSLRDGDSLTIRPGPWGTWCYLAVAGQLRAPDWLGARATHATSGLGGGKLAAGQVWTVDQPHTLPRREGPIPCPVWARPSPRVPVVLGPQDRFFAPETVEALLTRPFRLSPAFDRMGARLDGPRLVPEGALSIPSEAVLRGSVQVSGDGVATVLLADHQTTGGYPKIATIPGHDTDRLAQMRPGDTILFHAIPPEAALHQTRLRAGQLAACIQSLHQR